MVKRILNYFISYEFREGVIDQLIENFIPAVEKIFKSYYVSPAEIKEMSEKGMLIGSHSIDHPVMSRLTNEEQVRQISESFKFLESLTTKHNNVKTFCYPYGGFHSFSNETEAILDSFDCLFSFNVEQRDISFNDVSQRPQALPRYDCNQFKHGQVKLNQTGI
ncbi:MAG: polysaccharide deacetylase family protein [Bacteroidetes bacterium]|nr:polysaccharide deacetylase family protein [Bacteroidota bacterium]